MESVKYAKLRGRIVEKYGTIGKFSDVVGLSNVSMSKKLTGLTGFSQADIIRWCELLEIDLSEVGAYFFTNEVKQG